MLDDRKLAVLRAIVEDYVSTNEPVGSKSLVDRHNLDVSPATIRNDMAVLEEQGFIVQPHTSAGRIPTDQGYRLFVDRLSGVKPLSAAERRAIETFLAGAYDLDDVVMRTVRLLAQLTRQVAVVQYPSLTKSSVRHIELVPLTDRAAAAGPDHRHRPGRAAHGRTARARSATRRSPSCGRCSTPAWTAESSPTWPRSWPSCRSGSAAVDRPNAAAVFSVIVETLVDRHEERVVVGGAANLTQADFSRGLREVLEALEEQVVLMRLLGESGDQATVTVRIGSENEVQGLRSTSLVATGYGPASSHWPGSACSVRPGWTTRRRWERYARWHAM